MKKSPAKLAKYFQKNEPLIFEQKYGKRFIEGMDPIKKALLLLKAFASILFLPLSIFIVYKLFGEEYIKFGMIIGFIVLFYGFYTSVFKMMGKSQERWPDILAFINEKLPNTNLQLKDSNLNVSAISVGYQLQVEGTFKGRQIQTKYKTSGSAAEKLAGGSQMLMSGNFITTISLHKDVTADVIETNPDFPEPYARKISIEAKNKTLTENLADLSVLPFYTLQGLIVYLDFLESVATKLEI